MSEFFGVILIAYMLFSTFALPMLVFNVPILDYKSWECTKSVITKNTLPREESCIEWSKKSNHSNGEQS